METVFRIPIRMDPHLFALLDPHLYIGNPDPGARTLTKIIKYGRSDFHPFKMFFFVVPVCFNFYDILPYFLEVYFSCQNPTICDGKYDQDPDPHGFALVYPLDPDQH
jgi:hypothetical protein